MDKPQSGQSAGDYEDGDDPVVPPIHVLHANHKHDSHQGTHNEDVGGEIVRDLPQAHKPWLWERLIRREKIGWDRAVELLFAGVIVLFSWLQFESSQATSHQIQTIIDAANQIKSAAWTFSGAAQGINNAGWSAVTKLNDQATQLGNNVTQAGRLADDTEKANANMTASDRPWVGGQIEISSFEAGKKATFTVTYVNSGKRPAILDFTGARGGFFTTFPADPRSEYFKSVSAHGEAPSKAVIVPGGWTKLTFITETELDAPLLELTAKDPPPIKYFVFSTAEYRDLKTNEPHYTRLCFIYYQRVKGPNDSGFRNCQEYNDAN
jgi:hypothetical protein